MQRRTTALLAALFCGLLFVSCASTSSQRTKNLSLAMSYDGPMPSAMAQKALMKVRGQSFGAAQATTGEGAWTVGRYSITESADGSIQPMLQMSRGDYVIDLPVLTDGDVQFVFENVLMTETPVWGRGLSPELQGRLSELFQL